MTITLDGKVFEYPTAGVPYAQDEAYQNTGVLPLPPIRFKDQLRITYLYAGGGREISGYAVVLPD